MNYNHKKVIVSVIYRSPSQSNIEFDLFLANLEQLLCEINNRKPYLSLITLMQDLLLGGLRTVILLKV